MKMLTLQEIKFLQVVKRRQGTGDPAIVKMPASPGIVSLSDRGYLRFTNLRAGPLLVPIEELGLVLTEAGETALLEEEK